MERDAVTQTGFAIYVLEVEGPEMFLQLAGELRFGSEVQLIQDIADQREARSHDIQGVCRLYVVLGRLVEMSAEDHTAFGRAQRLVLSPLTDEQHEEAQRAFNKLGGTYTLTEAAEFFLRHHRPPDFTIRLADAVKLYIDGEYLRIWLPRWR